MRRCKSKEGDTPLPHPRSSAPFAVRPNHLGTSLQAAAPGHSFGVLRPQPGPKCLGASQTRTERYEFFVARSRGLPEALPSLHLHNQQGQMINSRMLPYLYIYIYRYQYQYSHICLFLIHIYIYTYPQNVGIL